MGCASSVNSEAKDNSRPRPNSMVVEAGDIVQRKELPIETVEKSPRELSSNSVTSASKVTIITPSVSLQKHEEPKLSSNHLKSDSSIRSTDSYKAKATTTDTTNSIPTTTTKKDTPAPILTTNSVESINSTNSHNKSIYKAIKIGSIILIRDSFYSKYSGKLMFKWREAEIIELDENNPRRVFIHFIGWNSSFDVWMDLEEEIHKIAPMGLLSKPEIDAGVALDTNQMQLVKYYLLTGNSVSQQSMTSPHTQTSHTFTGTPTSQPTSASSSMNNMSSVMSSPHPYPSTAPASAASSPSRYYTLQKTYSTENIFPPQSYEVGQPVDILDIFYRPGSDTPTAKWRKAKIIDKRDTKIRITYMGWDSKFDETLDINENSNRISAFGTKSTEQTSIATAAQKTPDSSKKSKFTFNFTSNHPASPSGTNQEEGNEEGEECSNTEGEEDDEGGGGDSNNNNNTNNNNSNEDGKKKKKVKKKKSSFSFGKMMSKAINSISTTGNGGSTTERKNSGKGGKDSTNNNNNNTDNNTVNTTTSQQQPETSRNNNTNEAGRSNGTNNNATSSTTPAEREPTAEEIEAFEKEINKERVFIHTLQQHGYHIIEIEGDGNCLFRAISHQLYLNEEYHEQLRYFCVEHLKKHQKRFEKFIVDCKFDHYIEEMSKNGTWADDIEIRAMEEILDRNIHIYSSNSINPKDYLIPVNENPEEEKLMQGVIPINLSYHGQSHYNSIYYDRTPLPLPLRNTKVLLNARLALNEGKTVPLPTTTLSHSHQSNSNHNGTPQKNLPPHAMNHHQHHSPSHPYHPYYPPMAAPNNNNNNGMMVNQLPVKGGGVSPYQANYLNNLKKEGSAGSGGSANSYHSGSGIKPTGLPSSSNNGYDVEKRRPSLENSLSSNHNTGNKPHGAHHVRQNSKELPPLTVNRDYSNTTGRSHPNTNQSISSNHNRHINLTSVSTATDSTEESTPNVSLNYSAVYADNNSNPGTQANLASSSRQSNVGISATSYRSSSGQVALKSENARAPIFRASNYPYDQHVGVASNSRAGGIPISAGNGRTSKGQSASDRMIQP